MKEKPSCRSCSYLSKPMISRYHPYSRTMFFCTHPDVNKCATEYMERTGKWIMKTVNFLGFKEPPKTSLRWCPLKKQTVTKEVTNGNQTDDI